MNGLMQRNRRNKRGMAEVLLGIAIGVPALIGAGIGYLYVRYPVTDDAPNIKVEVTPERVARGQYLANSVALCMDCHSVRDFSLHTGPLKPDTLGKGGEHFGEEFEIPGDIYVPNITPAALKDWTDGEIARAVVGGVSKDGRALFPMMPYTNYRHMSEEDVYAIIAYVRSLAPIENKVPRSDINFPVSAIARVFPNKMSYGKMPDKADQLAYGKYVTTIAGCADCHSPDHGQDEETKYSGGDKWKLPWGYNQPPNLTPDKETGIGTWTKEQFIAKFKAHAGPEAATAKLAEGQVNTIMPWTFYATMTDEDLGAIYTFLSSLKPVKNKVTATLEPLSAKQ